MGKGGRPGRMRDGPGPSAPFPPASASLPSRDQILGQPRAVCLCLWPFLSGGVRAGGRARCFAPPAGALSGQGQAWLSGERALRIQTPLDVPPGWRSLEVENFRMLEAGRM